MNTDSADALLLRDDQGQYYLLTREILQQCHLSADRAALLDQQLQTEEVSGYGMFGGFSLIPVVICADARKGGSDSPTESLSLNFSKIRFTYQ